MKEYGLLISCGSLELEVYLTPMAYFDWVYYSRPSAAYDSAAIRYLVRKYVTRIYLTGGVREEVDKLRLLTRGDELNDIAITKPIIDKLLESSGFSNPEAYEKTVEEFSAQGTRIMGHYDFFLFRYGGASLYLELLQADAIVRAQVIALFERMVGFTVAQRFRDGVEFDRPVDLETPATQYAGKMKRDSRAQQQRTLFRQPSPAPNNIPKDVAAMIESSREALARDLELGRTQKEQKQKRYYNWESDNADFMALDRGE